MKIDDIVKALKGERLTAAEVGASTDIESAYTGDLLSDVMANAPDGSILITIQAHKNSVAVASLAGIGAILLCNNRKAPSDMVEAAEKEGIAILRTTENPFQASCRVGALLSP